MTNQQYLVSTLTSTGLPQLSPGSIELSRWQQVRFGRSGNFNQIHREFLQTFILDRPSWFLILRRIVGDLVALKAEEDSDGYIFRPSEYAFHSVITLLSGTYGRDTELANRLPKPFVSPDGRGGIRVEWSIGDRIVSLLFPASAQRHPYIYHAAGEEHGANRQVSVDSLSMSLRWLLDND